MNDRPSEKPPSVFTRVFNGRSTPSVDRLMDDYIDSQNEPAKAPPARLERPQSMATQLSGLTHHANTSISSSATFSSRSENRHSGIFRIGRTIASSINPLNIWQKVAIWREKDDQDDEPDEELVQRQIRAEQAYAELKKTGQLHTLGSRSKTQATFAPAYALSAQDLSKQRDSDAMMTEDLPPSLDPISMPSQPSRISATPGNGSVKKSAMHFRTPSLQNLKKMVSETNLHRRSASASIEKPPTAPDLTPTLRPSSSRKDLVKQAKLSRRVSDLEVKLEMARRELDTVRSNTPNHPLFPEPRPVSRSNILRRFAPLPTLHSESLLIQEENTARPTTAIKKEQSPSLIKIEIDDSNQVMVEEENMTRPTTAIKKEQSPSLIKMDIDDSNPVTVEREADLMQYTTDEDLPPPPPIVDPVSFFDSSTPETTPKQSFRGTLRKRKSTIQDTLYRQTKDEGEQVDSESSTAKHLRKSRKPRKEQPGTTSPPKASRPDLGRPKPRVLTKPPPAISLATITADPHTLETVQEESFVFTTSTQMPLNDTPTRPNSRPRLTPAQPRQPHHRHARSMSPIKTPRAPLGDASGVDQVVIGHYRTRSNSPSSRMNCRAKETAKNISGSSAKENDQPLRIRPNGTDVPPLPIPLNGHDFSKQQQIRKEEWEWPEDVF
jgi:hypothetical protein